MVFHDQVFRSSSTTAPAVVAIADSYYVLLLSNNLVILVQVVIGIGIGRVVVLAPLLPPTYHRCYPLLLPLLLLLLLLPCRLLVVVAAAAAAAAAAAVASASTLNPKTRTSHDRYTYIGALLKGVSGFCQSHGPMKRRLEHTEHWLARIHMNLCRIRFVVLRKSRMGRVTAVVLSSNSRRAFHEGFRLPLMLNLPLLRCIQPLPLPAKAASANASNFVCQPDIKIQEWQESSYQ